MTPCEEREEVDGVEARSGEDESLPLVALLPKVSIYY